MRGVVISSIIMLCAAMSGARRAAASDGHLVGLASFGESQAEMSRGAHAATDPELARYLATGPFAVESFLADWHDGQRNRTIPVKVYYPTEHGQPPSGPMPVILFSHGLGGSREAAAYLGRHWASHGYVSVHLQHPGSDESVWRGKDRPIEALREAARNPRAALDRVADVRFVLDQMEQLQREPGPLNSRLDLERIGMSGHSFGAHTTLVVAGQVAVWPGGREISQADPRIKAAVILSPPVPQRPDQREKAFRKIAIPCFYMTGTEDDSPIGETHKEDRRIPFDLSGDLADRYLVIFAGGDHMIFSGRERSLFGTSVIPRGGLLSLRRAREKDEVFHRLICAATTAFWEAYLRGNEKARQWLVEGGFEKVLGSEGTFEKKLIAPPASRGGAG
jgi:predicted dienelactone hydrolase